MAADAANAKGVEYEALGASSFVARDAVGGGDFPDLLLTGARASGASALIAEPVAEGMRLRLRIAGVMRDWLMLSPRDGAAFADGVRMRAGLGAPGTERARSGGFTHGGTDVAVLVMPVLDGRHARGQEGSGGERLHLRLADERDRWARLGGLGMTARQLADVDRAIGRGGGLVLVAGPAGSGRTTTLRALLHGLADETRDMVAIGDAGAEGATPCRVDAASGFSLVDAITAAREQGADVVMIDMLADRAEIVAAMDGALSGQMVLAGIDASTAVEAIQQLRGRRVEAGKLAAGLSLVIAQRLARRLCAECRTPEQARGSVSALLGFDPGTIVHAPAGCPACADTGFAGQTGVFEVIAVDASVRRLIDDGGDSTLLARHVFLTAPNIASSARGLVRDGVLAPDDAVQLSRDVALSVIG